MQRVDGTRLRALRQATGRSVEDLATAAGMSPTTLRNLERGNGPAKPKPPFLAAIAAVLGVEVEAFTVEVNPSPSQVSA
ncbi:MAG TPA: helix-turn-helix transcriptional regulator [Mycobacteriales bacterium]|nr:helix-turn-helix transcriptional regulator [Mycobacteriales bacterium]